MDDLPFVAGVNFREVPDFPNYAVGDDGSVWSKTNRGIPRLTPRWNRRRTKTDRDGHLHVSLRRAGLTFHRLVHRLVLLAFVGPCPDGMEACHFDGNPANNALSNLRWDTHKGNILDKHRHGTWNSYSRRKRTVA